MPPDGPGLIHPNPPHHLRRDAEEVRADLSRHAPLADQAQVGPVDERRRLQGMAGPLATENPAAARAAPE